METKLTLMTLTPTGTNEIESLSGNLLTKEKFNELFNKTFALAKDGQSSVLSYQGPGRQVKVS
jgi:hypothetical protein